MEEILNTVNGEFIRLPYAAIRRNNKIIKDVLDQLIEALRQDPLFNGLYREKYYGGSYYVGLKVGRPNEYDIDILLALPKCAGAEIKRSNNPGFVSVRMQAMHIFHKQRREAAKYPNLGTTLLDDEDYLSSTKTSAWMESILAAAFNRFPNANRFETRYGAVNVTFRKAGPALTLMLHESAATQGIKVDIDLVPCFTFDHWPDRPFRQNPYKWCKPEFFIVPKRPHRDANERNWRLSFQQQEKTLIKNKKTLKAALRLLKKLRDTEKHPISSYHITTIFMWQVDWNRSFFDNSLSDVFLGMLILYKKFITNGKIPYYWDERNNLLEGKLSEEALEHISNRLEVIISKMQRNPDNTIEYLLKEGERRRFRSQHPNLLQSRREA